MIAYFRFLSILGGILRSIAPSNDHVLVISSGKNKCFVRYKLHLGKRDDFPNLYIWEFNYFL